MTPKNDASKHDIRDIDSSIAGLILFLQNGPKTELEILAGIPAFKNDTLGKARRLELVEHCNRVVWLTSEGEHLAATHG